MATDKVPIGNSRPRGTKMSAWIFLGVVIVIISGVVLRSLLSTTRGAAVAMFDKGVAATKVADYDRAISAFTKAIELDPQFAVAYYNRGHTYSELKEWHKSIADLGEAIRWNPELAEAFSCRGYVYANIGRFESALADSERSIELDPSSAGCYGNRGYVHLQMGRFDRAIADTTKAVELDPQMAPAYKIRAIAYYNVGDFPAAIADCSRVLQLRPDDAEACALRGAAFQKVGEDAKAREDVKKATRLGGVVSHAPRMIVSDVVQVVRPYHDEIDEELKRLADLQSEPESKAEDTTIVSRCVDVSAKAQSYCCRVTLYGDGQELVRLGLDYEAPDKFLVTQVAQDSESGELYDQWITIGKRHYQNVGVWGEMPDARNDKLNASLLSACYLRLLQDSNCAPFGAYRAKGDKYLVLRYRSVKLDGVFFSQGRTRQLDIWIDCDTALLTKCEAIQEIPDPESDKSGELRVIHVFGAFNRRFGIEAPHLNMD